MKMIALDELLTAVRLTISGHQQFGQSFRFLHFSYDVTGILRGIEAEAIPLRGVMIDAEEIAFIASSIQHLDTPIENIARRVSVDQDYAAALAESATERPLLIGGVDPGSGYLQLPELSATPDFVLMDGNHRLAKAYRGGLHQLLALIVPFEITRKFREAEDDLD